MLLPDANIMKDPVQCGLNVLNQMLIKNFLCELVNSELWPEKSTLEMNGCVYFIYLQKLKLL